MTQGSDLSSTSKKVVPVLLAIAIFMQMLDVSILNTALPSIAHDLHESPLNMQLIIISYTLTLALLAPISGAMADRFGTKHVFILAISLFSLGSLLCALSPSLNALVMSRIVQAMGGAILVPVARLSLLKAYDRSEFLRVLNYALTPALLGPIIGPVVGGYLVEIASWHWIFLLNIPIGVVCIILSIKFMPNFADRTRHFDLIGYLIFGLAIFLVSVGLEFIDYANFTGYALAVLAIGIILLINYLVYARQKKDALFPLSLFYIRTFRLGLYGNLIARLGITAMPFLLPLFLQVGMGYSPSESGWMLIPMAVSGILIKSNTTTIIHYFGYRRVLVWNTVCISVAIMSIGFFGTSLSKLYLIIILFFLGFFNSIQFSAMNSLTLAKLRPYQESSGSSLMVVNQQLALSLGVSLTAIFLNFFGKYEWNIFTKATEAFQLTFVAVGFATLLAVLIFLHLHPKDGDRLANR